jgi:Transposase
MAIVGGFDMHRAQITFDCLDTDTGELSTGQIRPATRATLRHWLVERFGGRSDVAIALEGCTGWRFVVEELTRAGVEAHLAEPADTATLRGRKKRPKTDRADARLLRELLHQRRLPESWIPPDHVLEVRTLAGRTSTSWTSDGPGNSASTPSCSTRAWPRRGACSPVGAGQTSSVPSSHRPAAT